MNIVQSCLTLCNPMDCSLPGSSVHRDSPGKNTGVGSHSFLQGIFLTQGPNLGLLYLLHCRQILYHLGHQGSRESQSPTSGRLRETPPPWSPPVSQVTILCLTLVGDCLRAHNGPAPLCHVVCKGGEVHSAVAREGGECSVHVTVQRERVMGEL